MWRAGCGADQVLELMDMFENKKIKIKKNLFIRWMESRVWCWN
jgi:hypothetical protein